MQHDAFVSKSNPGKKCVQFFPAKTAKYENHLNVFLTSFYWAYSVNDYAFLLRAYASSVNYYCTKYNEHINCG